MTHSETLAETMLLQREAKRSKLRVWIVAFIVGMAVALGLAVTTAPARADDRDLARALAAIAIVGIIATAAKDRDGDRDGPRHEQHPHYPPQQARAPRVPAVCGIEISGRSTRATVYGERCLRDEGFDWRLPRHCARPARIYGQNDRIYTEQCLRDAGFRIGGRRN